MRHPHPNLNFRSLFLIVCLIGIAQSPLRAGVAMRGDFNGDGYADLAIGVPGEDIGLKANAGGVNVIYGSAGGLSSTDAQFWDSMSVVGSAAAGDAFGSALANGDFNNDGYADLAIGVPLRNTSGQANSGAVVVMYGSATGLAAIGYQLISQDSPGIVNAPGADDRFGAALIAGDFNGDTFEDLAVGVPGETVKGQAAAGAVCVILGSGTGLVSTGNKLWSQDSPSIADVAEIGDAFGLVLAAADFDNDTYVDLAIGAPLEDINSASDAGMVHVLYGSASGLTAAASQRFRQNSGGVLGTADKGDNFGAALAAGDFNGDGLAELAIGVPRESFSGKAKAGLIHVIDGTPAGLNPVGSSVWMQNAGFGDGVQANDLFGAALAAGDTNNDGHDDLLIGVPGEGLTNAPKAGAVHCVFGSAGGLTTTNNQFWHAFTFGFAVAQPGSLMGTSLTVGDFDGDSTIDGAFGCPGRIINAKVGAGDVYVMYGSVLGFSSTDIQTWDQDKPNIPDSAETGDQVGASLGR